MTGPPGAAEFDVGPTARTKTWGSDAGLVGPPIHLEGGS